MLDLGAITTTVLAAEEGSGSRAEAETSISERVGEAERQA